MDESRRWKCQRCGWYGKSRETIITYSGQVKGIRSRLCPRCHTKVIHVVGAAEPAKEQIV